MSCVLSRVSVFTDGARTSSVVFFFQAEDGIRDHCVTGVQTCALPIWKELSPDKPFEYSFLDEDVAKQYKSYQRWMSIMGLSTGFAILISCLGLFGLSGINALNRTKEMGIRKVMGAGVQNIFILLNRQFIGLAFVAFTIAAPLSWYVMNKWLKDFQVKITIGWELFAMSMAAGLAVALITVSDHALETAWVNHAETLKNESNWML